MNSQSKYCQSDPQKAVGSSGKPLLNSFVEVTELRQVQTGEQQIFSKHLYMQSELIRFNQQALGKNLQRQLLFTQIINDINFSQGMREKIGQFKAVLLDIKATLEISNEQSKNQNQKAYESEQKYLCDQQYGYKLAAASKQEKEVNHIKSSQNSTISPPLIYKQTKKIEISQQIQCSRVVNKLKVIVSKVEERKSDIQNRHPFEDYVTRLIDDLQDDKMKKNFTQRNIQRNHEMIDLKNKFKVLNYTQILRYKMHPTTHPDFEIPQTLFYVNLYNEALLFLSGEPICSFNTNILFCPILLQSMSELTWQQQKSHIAISQWYIDQLNQENTHWMDFSLYIFVRETRCFHRQQFRNSKILYWSKASVEKMGNKMREKSLINHLKKIRGFVYMNMVFKWLKMALLTRNVQNSTSINIEIDKDTTFQIATTTSPCINEDAVEKPGLIKHFLSYFSEHKMRARNEKKREDITLNFISAMKGLIKMMYIEHVEQYQTNTKHIYISGKRIRR